MQSVSDSTSFFGQTCTTANECASISASVEYHEGLGWNLWAGFQPVESTAFHSTALSLFAPILPATMPDIWTGPSGWVGFTSLTPPWQGYYHLASLSVGRAPEWDSWWWSGPGYSGDMIGWRLDGPINLSGLRWGWRGETEEGQTFDCFEGEACALSIEAGRASTATVTPEPATWGLTLVGLITLALARRRFKAYC